MIFDEVSREFVIRKGKLSIDARKLGESWGWLSATWGAEDDIVFVNRGEYSGRNSELISRNENSRDSPPPVRQNPPERRTVSKRIGL